MDKAIDQKAVVNTQVVVKLSPTWSPGSVNTTTNQVLTSSSLQKRPDTIRNKPDVWGFRKMSPWSRKWLTVAAPVYSFQTKVKSGHTGWYENLSTMSAGSRFYRLEADQPKNLDVIRPSGGMQVSADNQARTKVLSRVSQKKWDLGTFALELSETVQMASSLTRDIGRAYKKIAPDPNRFTAGWRKQVGRFDKAFSDEKSLKQLGRQETDLLNRFADRWMEYTFGIKPALYDIHDATEYLNSQIGRPLLGFAKAGATRTEQEPVTIEMLAYHSLRLRKVTEYSVHYSLLYRSETEGVSQLTALGLDNPWAIGWEKLPYSWLIDYGIGIGDWLQSWSAANGVKLVSGCRTTIWRGRLEYVDVILRSGLNLEWVKKASPTLNFQGGEMDRSLLSSFPTPAFAPNFKQSVGGFQLANALFALKNLVHLGVPKR